MSLGDWLNSVILHQAAEDGVPGPSRDYDDDDDELSSVHQRLDDLSRRIEQVTRTGPAAYAPKRARDEGAQIAELIERLDRRLDQFVNSTRPLIPRMSSALPLPKLDRAMQDISGLEDQLHRITNQIETLRKPGVEEAINALRAELGDIGRALNDAMPRRAIETIERQIAGLTQRIAEGRQAGVDGSALTGIEHGLAEVRDALRSLTPAENLVGFNDAVAGLARKIDLIVSQKDPVTLQQFEQSITTLREMAAHVASNEAVGQLAAQVQMLADKVDHLAANGGATGALNNLEHRISALADALEQRAQSDGNVPPMVDALVHSLSDKIELIQQSRGDSNLALGHLEDRIVKLVERLDVSDSRLSHLEAIERGLADLLVHIDEMRASKDSGGGRVNVPEVDALKTDMARTQNALEQVHGTLGLVVDRLATIERGIRGEARPRPVSDEEFAEIAKPVGRVTAHAVTDAPPLPAPLPPTRVPQPAAAAPPPPPAGSVAPPKRLPPVSHMPINRDLPGDQPLEPGSGPPPLRAGARIAPDATNGARSGASGAVGQSGFIAAARRAAQAAAQSAPERTPVPEPMLEHDDADAPSLRVKLVKKVKSLFIAASIIAVVVGSLQIVGNFYDFGNFDHVGVQTATRPERLPANRAATAEQPVQPSTTTTAGLIEPPKQTAPVSASPLALPSANTVAALASPPAVIAPASAMPSLLSPPMLSGQSDVAADIKTDVTGSVGRPAASRPARSPAPQLFATGNNLPIAIGGPRLRNAAMAGDPTAAFEIAVRFAGGRGVPTNLEEAARWYERAANKGLAPAQFRYASLLEKGQGVRKDLAQARRLYLAAASKGNGKAMHNLAVLYAEGIEGKPDYATAALWFRKAAQHGIADSQYNLGVLCARGLGTKQSFDESYKWFALAAAQGDREAGKKRDEMATHLDADALAAAAQATKAFVAEPQPDEATAVAEPVGGWDRAATTPAAHPKPRLAPPMSLGSFEMGLR